MKKILPYLKGYRKQAVLGPLFKLLEACLELLVPLVVARIIDVAIPEFDRGYALNMCLVLVALGLVGLVFAVVAQYFAAAASTGLCSKLRNAVFCKIQTFSCAQTESMGPSTLITRLTGDMNQLQTGVNLALRLMLRSPFVVVGAAVMAFTVDRRSALIFVGAIPALSIAVFTIMLISMPLYKKVQSALDGILSSARENLTGVRVIRAFGREEAERKEFAKRNDIYTEEQRGVSRISALLNPVTYVIINVAIIVLMYTGVLRIEGGDLTPGQLVALYNYMSQILVELIKFADLMINVTRAAACADRIADILDIEGEDNADAVKGRVTDGQADVSFNDVSFRYSGAHENSIEHISFSAPSGSFIGIIGSTGSGKSTLVNLIPRFYDATEGEVTVGGKNVTEYERGELRSMMAVVPQKIDIFKGTLRSNIALGEEVTDEEILKAAEAAQALDVISAKGGLSGIVEQNGRNLSGGQKQRIAIARALLRNPRILILDDSSSALDFATDRALRASVKKYSKDMTVFTVSQRTSSIAHCDSIIVLEDGEQVGMGTHDTLLESCPVYREIYESQFKKEGAK